MNNIKRLHYSVITPESVGGILNLGNDKIEISFEELGVDDRLLRPAGETIDGFRSIGINDYENQANCCDLLNWLSVWFGEDIFPSRKNFNTEYPGLRGGVQFDIRKAQKFFDHIDNWKRQNLTNKWKMACLDTAFGYFCSGLAAGLSMTPATTGIFAFCMETIGNIWLFNPNKHIDINDRNGIINIFSEWPDKDQRKRLEEDLCLVTTMRNTCGAHFSLHKERERKHLVKMLRKLMQRKGCSPDFANLSFTEDGLLDELQREAPSIYKTSLTVTRACFFAATKGWDYFTFAQKDFS